MQGFGLDRRIVIGFFTTLACALALIAIIVQSPAEAGGNTTKPATLLELQNMQEGTAKQVTELKNEFEELENKSENAAAVAGRVSEVEADVRNQALSNYAVLALAVVSLIVAALSYLRQRGMRSQLSTLIAEHSANKEKEDAEVKNRQNSQDTQSTSANLFGNAGKPTAHPSSNLSPGSNIGDTIPEEKWSFDEDTLEAITRPPAQLVDSSNGETTIALDQVRRLVEHGASGIASEYRENAEAIGHLFVLTIDNGTLRAAPNEDDGNKHWLIALLNNDGYGILAPSHDYVKDFSISHHKVGAPATVLLATFFKIDITSDGSLRYDLPCYVRRVGSDFIVEGRGKLSGFSH